MTAAAPTAEPGIAARITGLAKRRESGVALALVLLLVVATIANPSFLLDPDSRLNLMLAASLLILLAVGETFVIITKNIDLSIGSVLGLTAYATGTMFRDWHGVPIVLVMIAGTLLGALLGVANGVLVSVAKVPALVITLGTLYVIRGIDVAWAGSSQIVPDDMPGAYIDLGVARLLGVPVLLIIALVALAVAAVFLATRRAGREFYAIGSDDAAARLYGLPVGRRVFTAFVVSGTCAGLAGVLYAARYGSVSSTAGTGIELQAVAAAVIGGVAIFGGSGTVIGAALGAALLTAINSSLPTIGVPDFWQQAVVGALILGAIVIDRVLQARVARRLQDAHGAPELKPATSTGTDR